VRSIRTGEEAGVGRGLEVGKGENKEVNEKRRGDW